ncbi:MAG: hypothetical protein K8T91_08865 [Planctomycetes bacterium]|nr:hypothetical protein [Planctomycetota bacterium]
MNDENAKMQIPVEVDSSVDLELDTEFDVSELEVVSAFAAAIRNRVSAEMTCHEVIFSPRLPARQPFQCLPRAEAGRPPRGVQRLSAQLGLITADSLRLNLLLAPAILAGNFVGLALLKRIPEEAFHIAVQLFALLGALKLILPA